MIRDKLFDFTNDPTKKFQSPKVKDELPYLDFSNLENTMEQLKNTAEEFQKQYSSTIKLPADKKMS